MDQHLNNSRSCESCTMCCQGWLHGIAHGYSFYPGKPCHFICDKGCSIYENRPDEPCKSYKCAWLIDNYLPEWFRPDSSKVICTWRSWNTNHPSYLAVNECGEKLDSKILSWLYIQHLNGFLPYFTYTINGGFTAVGDKQFLDYIGVS